MPFEPVTDRIPFVMDGVPCVAGIESGSILKAVSSDTEATLWTRILARATGKGKHRVKP